MKKFIKLFTTCYFIVAIFFSTAYGHDSAKQNWQALAFGQSTDVNFSSLIKPEKVGFNNVWVLDQLKPIEVGQANPLYPDFVIESRGGKIANSHDGMTVFYKALPVSQTFILEADVILEQLGPEVDGKTPATQEAAGLFVRDIIGTARKEPQPTGYEEFPNASNMLMNAFISQNKKNDNLVQVTALTREGVRQTWGNEGIKIDKVAYQKNIDYSNQYKMHLKIERNATQFILSWQDLNNGQSQRWVKNDYSGFVNQQDKEQLYVGFFAARNAKIRVLKANLTLTDSAVDYVTLDQLVEHTRKIEPQLLLASATKSLASDYVLQLQTSHQGKIVIKSANDEKTYDVIAGEMVRLPTLLQKGQNRFLAQYYFNNQIIEKTIIVDYQANNLIKDLKQIYAANIGKPTASGTLDDPVDLTTAISLVSPNGTIYLADGIYQGIDIILENSGLQGQLKTLQAQNTHQAIFTDTTFNLDGHYWQLNGVAFDGNIDGKDNQPAFLRISGSHNIINHVIARNNSDTGIAITAKNKKLRSLWPAYNLIVNSDSYNNQDRSGINADGFAAKLGVGVGNIFRGCIAHHNADDGWDLFNKIEDGPNEPVLIENSIAYQNGRPFNKPDIVKGSIGNGFKLGGEGQPVAHKIIYSMAFDNNMDGFTDNFNTGNLVIKNNIAIDNARYNYIVRSNPYPFLTPQVSFKHNFSIRTDWHNQIEDSLGSQVIDQENKQLTILEYFGTEKPDIVQFIKRDAQGNLMFNLPIIN